MSDERVNVSKGLLDNVAKLLMQATETTDNLSLPEMATAAQMMLPAKWELVVDTTIEQEVSEVYFTIPNVDEVVIFAQNANGLNANTDRGAHYVMMWGQIFLVDSLVTAQNKKQKTTITHGIKLDEYAMADWSSIMDAISIYNGRSRSGCPIPQIIKNDKFGLNVEGDSRWAIGTKLKIWAKRRVNANEQGID